MFMKQKVLFSGWGLTSILQPHWLKGRASLAVDVFTALAPETSSAQYVSSFFGTTFVQEERSWHIIHPYLQSMS